MKLSAKLALVFTLIWQAMPVCAQQNYRQMEQMLNQIYPDTGTQSGFASGSAPAAMQQGADGSNYSQQMQQPQQMQQWQQPQQMQQWQSPQQMQQFPMAPVSARPFLGRGASSLPAASSNWGQQKPRKFSLLKTMFGDSSPGDASGNASRAQTQAGVAHNAYLRSYYGDYYTRSQAADEAYYAAEEARREADNAYYKIQSGAPGAQSYYDTARAAADNAQYDADSARTNADRAYR